MIEPDELTAQPTAQGRDTFLAEASDVLASSLDYEKTLDSVAALVVPRLADWCAIDMLSDDGQRIERFAVAHTDAAKVEFARELQELYPPRPDDPLGVPNVLRTGEPELYAEISDELLEQTAQDADHLRIVRSLGLRSAIIVPLAARGRTFGAMTFVQAESGRHYTEEDLRFARDLGRRAAMSIDNARLYREAQEANRVKNESLRKLAESEAKFRRLAESNMIGVLFADTRGAIGGANDAFLRMVGYTREDLTHGRLRWHDMTPPGYEAIDERAIGELAERGVSTPFEKEYIRKDGTRVPVMVGAALLENSTHETICYVIDLTERRRAEEELRRSEKRFRSIFNQQFQFMAILSPDGVLLDVNDLPLRSTGVEREQVLGRLFWETIWWNHLPEMQESWRVRLAEAARSDEPVFSEDEYQTADGVTRVAAAAVTAVKDADGRLEFFIVQATDITERRRAAEALRESEDGYRRLADAMPQLVWATDENGSHLYYNRQWYDFTGLTEEESMGYGFALALHPDDRERTLKRWERAWRDGEGYSIEYRFYSRPQNLYRWFLGRATPVRDAAGRITQWVGTCTDINDQKEMAEQLARVSEERERLLEEVSTPIVPVLPGVLALPLVGSLDTERMARATEAALSAVSGGGAHTCIIDITGARIIDSHAVANLANLVTALKIIGADALVTGVTAQAARTLVHLGLDLSQIRTHRTLAEALSAVVNKNTSQGTGLRTNGTTGYIR